MNMIEEVGVRCPKCGEAHRLAVVVETWAVITDDGTDIYHDDCPDSSHEWSDESACRCAGCGWSGTMAEAESRSDPSKPSLFIVLDGDQVNNLDLIVSAFSPTHAVKVWRDYYGQIAWPREVKQLPENPPWGHALAWDHMAQWSARDLEEMEAGGDA